MNTTDRALPGLPNGKRPIHERIPPLGALRGAARASLFRFLRQLASTDDAKRIQVTAMRNLIPWRPELSIGQGPAEPKPYADLGTPPTSAGATERDDVIFITARFRSGSTLLWNLFRSLDNCTAYYEPFNERRWFDTSARGSHTDPTHRGVNDYWREYDGLEALGQYYQESWTDHDLFMDAHSWNPAMKRYVETLINHAPCRPVLQFNRIDFRLPWFRHHFPRARLIHLYRHPRDQWCSSLVDPKAVPRDLTPASFAQHDHYYLHSWVRDLKYYFPFLDETVATHPYQLFYYVWKLSYLFGRRFSHYSVAFEDLTADPEKTTAELLEAVNLSNAPLERLVGLIEAPRSGRWRDYAPEPWFQDHESACETVLSEFLRKDV